MWDELTSGKGILEILILTTIIYLLIKLLHKKNHILYLIFTLALFFVGGNILTYSLNLQTLHWLIQHSLQFVSLLIIVIFAPELRRFLLRVGLDSYSLFNKKENISSLEVLRDCCYSLAKKKIGALIVLERSSPLIKIHETGVRLNSEITMSLLESIFCPATPLHDGAVIIQENLVKTASCVLPLTENKDVSQHLGTRHRAGLGITEEYDCIVLIVSEERGAVSVAYEGKLLLDLSKENLIKKINKILKI